LHIRYSANVMIIILPKLQNVWENNNYHIVWKLRIDPSSDSYIKFTIKTWMEVSLTENHSFICNYLINIKFNYRIQI